MTGDELSAAAETLAALVVDIVERITRVEDAIAAVSKAAEGEIYDDLAATVQRTSIGRTKLLELASSGEIPSIRVGSRRVFPRHEVDAAMRGWRA